MNDRQTRLQSTPDQSAISDLIERWSKGVRDQDRMAIRQDHDADILMFDGNQPVVVVPGPALQLPPPPGPQPAAY